jgi:methionyl-tRNA formyltransferase
VQRALLAGDAETGVAVQRVERGLDAGPLLALRTERIRPDDDAAALLARLTELGAPLLADVVRRLCSGEVLAQTEQDPAGVTIAARIEKHEGELRFRDESAQQLVRRVHAFAEWPGCRFALPVPDTAPRADASETLRVRRAVVSVGGSGAPGTVLSADHDGVVIAARTDALRVLELQRPGGRPLPAGAFLNGRPIAPGVRVVE